MNSVNLILWPEIKSLTETFQSLDIKFAFVNEKYEQVHQPCKCRDFLGDLMWSRHTGNEVSIYGMKYDYDKNPYDLETTRLSLKFPDNVKMGNFIRNFSYLTDREQAHGIPVSILLKTDQPNTLIIEGDKNWQTSVWKLSLYTFYIKVMGYADVTKLDSPEDGYKEKLTDKFESKFLSKILSDINPIDESLGNNHNSSGFVSALYAYKNWEEYKQYKGYDTCRAVAKEVLGAA